MATVIKVVSGLLVIGDKFSVRADNFQLIRSASGVSIVSGIDGSKYDVSVSDAKIGSTVFTDPVVLFLAIAGLSVSGGGGSVSWDSVSGKPAVIGAGADAAAARTAIGAAPLVAPVFTGDARAVTAAVGDNDTSIATTAFVLANAGKTKAQIAALVSPAATFADLAAATTAVQAIVAALKA